MLPLDFFFLSVRPLIDIRLECKSEGKNYPPGVPLHVSRMLELEVVCPCWLLFLFVFKPFKKNDNKNTTSTTWNCIYCRYYENSSCFH